MIVSPRKQNVLRVFPQAECSCLFLNYLKAGVGGMKQTHLCFSFVPFRQSYVLPNFVI